MPVNKFTTEILAMTEAMLLAGCSSTTGEGPLPEEEIMARPGWENVTAVKNGAILNLQNNELSRPAPRLAEGAKMLYDFVYGGE